MIGNKRSLNWEKVYLCWLFIWYDFDDMLFIYDQLDCQISNVINVQLLNIYPKKYK